MSPGSVPLALVDALLGTVAGVLHDRPVQSLVAGRLLIETGVAADASAGGAGREMLDKGVGAVTRAADLCREVMWALTPPEVRPGSLAGDLRIVARALVDDDSIRLALGDDDDLPMVRALARAMHLAGADALLSGGVVHAVDVDSDAEQLQARLVVEGRPAGPVWLELAAAHLVEVGGTIRLEAPQQTADRRTVAITIPRPG